MKNFGKRVGFATAMVAALVLFAGCGVKSTPQFPEGATYPSEYPARSPKIEATHSTLQSQVQRKSATSSTQSENTAAPTQTGSTYGYPNPAGYQPPSAGPLFSPLTGR